MNAFNTFFTNIGSDINSEVRSQQHFTDFLTNSLPQYFNFTLVSETVLIKSLSNLESKESFREDGISTTFLKSVKYEFLKPLTTLINQMILTSNFPDKMKIAKVVLFYKKDDPTLLTNYRFVSALPAVSDFFERMHTQSCAYVEIKYFTHTNMDPANNTLPN